jgi:hypothetical protein
MAALAAVRAAAAGSSSGGQIVVTPRSHNAAAQLEQVAGASVNPSAIEALLCMHQLFARVSGDGGEEAEQQQQQQQQQQVLAGNADPCSASLAEPGSASLALGDSLSLAMGESEAQESVTQGDDEGSVSGASPGVSFSQQQQQQQQLGADDDAGTAKWSTMSVLGGGSSIALADLPDAAAAAAGDSAAAAAGAPTAVGLGGLLMGEGRGDSDAAAAAVATAAAAAGDEGALDAAPMLARFIGSPSIAASSSGPGSVHSVRSSCGSAAGAAAAAADDQDAEEQGASAAAAAGSTGPQQQQRVPPLSQHAMAQVAAAAGGNLPGGVAWGPGGAPASPDPPTPNFWKHPAVSRSSPAASISSRSASTTALAMLEATAAAAAPAAAAGVSDVTGQQQQQQQQGEEVTPAKRSKGGTKGETDGAEGEGEDVGSSPGGLIFMMSPVGQTPAPADRPAAAAAGGSMLAAGATGSSMLAAGTAEGGSMLAAGPASPGGDSGSMSRTNSHAIDLSDDFEAEDDAAEVAESAPAATASGTSVTAIPPATAAAAEEPDVAAGGSSVSAGSSVSFGNVMLGPGGSPVVGASRGNSWELHPAFGKSKSLGHPGMYQVRVCLVQKCCVPSVVWGWCLKG